MSILMAEIDRLKASIEHFDAVIPSAQGEALATFKSHRDWHIRILAGYVQAVYAARA